MRVPINQKIFIICYKRWSSLHIKIVLFLWLILLSNKGLLAEEVIFYCAETVNININFDDKISNYETGGVIIKVTEKNIIVDSPTGSGPQTLLRVQNHGKAGLGYENNYCSIYIPNSEAPKQLVCNYGSQVGVTIQNFDCTEF